MTGKSVQVKLQKSTELKLKCKHHALGGPVRAAVDYFQGQPKLSGLGENQSLAGKLLSTLAKDFWFTLSSKPVTSPFCVDSPSLT